MGLPLTQLHSSGKSPVRQIEFTKFVEPFVNPEDQGDDFDNDQEWEFARQKFVGYKKATPYKGYYVYSSALGGLVALGNHNLPSKNHNMWFFDTNFKITEHDLAVMDETDGIEAVEQATPYRGLLMVGRLFKTEPTLNNLRVRLCPPPIIATPAEKVDSVILAARTRFPCWAIVKTKSGKKDIVGGLDKEFVENRLKAREDVAEVVEYSWGKSD
jgi:hypothetical protein